MRVRPEGAKAWPEALRAGRSPRDTGRAARDPATRDPRPGGMRAWRPHVRPPRTCPALCLFFVFTFVFVFLLWVLV